MLRTITLPVAVLCLPALAYAQAPACVLELATVTVEVPTGGGNDTTGTIALWISGIAQAAGLAMIVVGASVRQRVRGVSIAFAPLEGGAALAVSGVL